MIMFWCLRGKVSTPDILIRMESVSRVLMDTHGLNIIYMDGEVGVYSEELYSIDTFYGALYISSEHEGLVNDNV